MKKITFVTALLVIFSLLITSAVLADYPERSIEVVVPWSPGGTTDTMARAFVPAFEDLLGKPLVVKNMPGASGAVGTEYVLNRKADGYTILFSAETPGVARVMNTGDFDFYDFEPIIMLAGFVPTVTVSADAPWDTVEEFIEDARTNKEIMAGYAGPGTTGHVATLLFKECAELDLATIPLGGGGAVTTALLGGHIDIQFAPLGTVIDHYRAGKFKLLATFTNEQVEGLEGVPPIGQAVPEFKERLPWGPMISILVKKGTPAEVVEKLEAAATEVANRDKWQEFLDSIYAANLSYKGQDFWNHVDKWMSITGWLLYDAGAAKTSPEELGIPRL